MNIEVFSPDDLPRNLKAARKFLGLSQEEMAKAVNMQQKDISLHENKTTKALIPVRYVMYLHSRGIDLNSLFGHGPVRLREEVHAPATAEKASTAADYVTRADLEELLRASVDKALEQRLRARDMPIQGSANSTSGTSKRKN